MIKFGTLGRVTAVIALAAGISLPAAALTVGFTDSKTQRVGSDFGNAIKYSGTDLTVTGKALVRQDRHLHGDRRRCRA